MALRILTGSPDPTSTTLTLEGQLDAVTAPELEQFLATYLDAGNKTLVLDLSRLHFVSSAGLRIFAKARKTMLSREGKLCFVNLSPQVQKVFEIAKAVPNTSIFRSVEELDAYLTLMQRRVTEEQQG
jgi:anti-sigma B factor antagonist